MEKKTIGSFIAALRKANGLTQKELAEKLNVSDKTISRWERDEGTPDLSLIPVIAEIFGITTDELLRRERRTASESDMTIEAELQRIKTEKQRQRILASSLTQYRNRSFLSVGLALAGLIAAMIANFGFNRAYIGFLSGAVLLLIAGICQAVFVNNAFFSVHAVENQEEEISKFKRSVISIAERSFGVMILVLGISLPLVVFPNDTYLGLTGYSWLVYGFAFGIGALVLCAITCCILNDLLLKKGTYSLDEKEAAVYRHNLKLKRKSVLFLVAVLLVTLIAHALATGGGDALSIMKGTSFDDLDAFKAYMEQEVPAPNNSYGTRTDSASEPAAGDNGTYYDEYGNEISEEEAHTRTITDPAGNIVCKFVHRNEEVRTWRISYVNGTVSSIMVYTMDDLYEGSNRIRVTNDIFAVVYLLEAAGVLLFYFKERIK